MNEAEFQRRLRLAGPRPTPDNVLAFWRWDSILLLGDSEHFRDFWARVESSQELDLWCEPGVYPTEQIHLLVFLLRSIYLHFLPPPPKKQSPNLEVTVQLKQLLEQLDLPALPKEIASPRRPGRPRRQDWFWHYGHGETALALLSEAVREVVGPRRYWPLSLKLLRHFSGGFTDRRLKKNPQVTIAFGREQLRSRVKTFRRMHRKALQVAQIKFREAALARAFA